MSNAPMGVGGLPAKGLVMTGDGDWCGTRAPDSMVSYEWYDEADDITPPKWAAEV